MFDVSVIIINFNSETYTINCIKSLIEHTSPNLQCQYVIVDNGSKKESYLALKKHIESLHNIRSIELIRSNINKGFGGGNMVGVQKSTGKYLAFINNDTVLENDCLTILKRFMDKQSNVGVCVPQAFAKNKEILPSIDHFTSLGKVFFGRKFLETLNQKKYPKRHKLYTRPKQGQFVTGSFMFFKSEDFNQIGGFDTNIFLYFEETDICKRLLKTGKLSFLVPEAKFIHYHGVSTKKSNDIKIEAKISLLYVIRKHYGIVHFYILLLFLQIKYFFGSILKPKHWSLFYILLLQAPLSKSLKHKQKIEHVS